MRSYLLLAALLPAVILLIRVYRLDKIEKEPPGLLLLLAAFGALGGVAAMIGESVLTNTLKMLTRQDSLPYLLAENFIAVALCEEFCKLLPVRMLAWRHPAFNYRFDAVVYCTASALGFAALENVLYVMQFGLSAAVSRAILSVPGHFFFAVFMGFYLGQAKAAQVYANSAGQKHFRKLALLVPTLLHGFWDFCLSFDSTRMNVVFLAFAALFFLYANRLLRDASAQDRAF